MKFIQAYTPKQHVFCIYNNEIHRCRIENIDIDCDSQIVYLVSGEGKNNSFQCNKESIKVFETKEELIKSL